MTRSLAATVILGALCLVTAGPVAAQSAAPVGSPTPADLSGARSVCEEKTGTVQVREAMFGTNDDPSAWVDMGRSVELCRFQAEDAQRVRDANVLAGLPFARILAVIELDTPHSGHHHGKDTS